MVKKNSSSLQRVTCAAIGMSSLLLFIFTITSPRFPSKSTLEVNSLHCESNETVVVLKKQVIELNQKLEEALVKSKMINPPNETINPKLAQILSKIAIINRELIVVLANSNVKHLLQIQFSTIKRLAISNYLVVALDDETVHLCKSNDVAFYKWDTDSAGKSSVGSVVSALKFRILRDFLQMGYNVLLTDTDVLFLQNPFHHLYRDSDVESMSDGYDTWSAYGYTHIYDDPEMMWSRYVFTTRIWSLNSGFFYIRATLPAIELLDRVTESLRRRPGAWDQAVYNEELLFPSHLDYVGLTAAKRVMDIYLFMNSNVLFRSVRKDPELRKRMPVVVHINYHPDKLPRMMATLEFYVNGKDNALDPFTDGTVRT